MILLAVTLIAFVVLTTLIIILSRYRKCPADKILVIYGKVGRNADGSTRSAKCIHGGSSFIWPIFQSFQYMDLTPISISADLKNALSRQNIRIDVPSRFTVGISTEPGVMQNAAERLLGLKMADIQDLAIDIIFGQLRLVVATMDIEEINTDRDKFLQAVSTNVEGELKKIGLRLINVNVTDINDDSGYIIALGREAAAQAINEAKKSVAEADRMGAIGEANAQRDQRIQVAKADSEAIYGENEAKIQIAQSDATRRQKEAEALRTAVSAEKIQEAKALHDAYQAQKEAELARYAKEEATLRADIIVKSEIEKKQIEIEAEARAEQIRRIAKGDADGLFAKMEAEARGMQEMLTKQAVGMGELVKASGGTSDDAMKLIIADNLEKLVATQVEAIKNLKIDKITVWDNGNNGGKGSATSDFISNLMKSIPPLNEIFGMAGMSLPEFLGKEIEQNNVVEAPEDVTQCEIAETVTDAPVETPIDVSDEASEEA